MPITFDEVTADVAEETETTPQQPVEQAQQKQAEKEEGLRRWQRFIVQRLARLWAD
jgi:hypothetical protein